jgi:hypothetical protein
MAIKGSGVYEQSEADATAVKTVANESDARARRVEKAARTPPAGKTIVIRNRSQAIHHAKILIAALQEALQYDPKRHHNQRPSPALYVNDQDYLREVRELIAELRIIIALLESERTERKRTSANSIQFYKHANTFLNVFAKTLAIGAGGLMIGQIAALLDALGLGSGAGQILKHIRH